MSTIGEFRSRLKGEAGSLERMAQRVRDIHSLTGLKSTNLSEVLGLLQRAEALLLELTV